MNTELSFAPNEVVTKGYYPRASVGESERSEHKMSAGLALRLVPFILQQKVELFIWNEYV